MLKLPKINQSYICYDDGKVKLSRAYKVIVKKIIPYKDADIKLKTRFKEVCDDTDWIFKSTKFFIIADSYEKSENEIETSIFAENNYKEWYSFGYEDSWFNNGVLDVDNSLTKKLFQDLLKYVPKEDIENIIKNTPIIYKVFKEVIND